LITGSSLDPVRPGMQGGEAGLVAASGV